MTTESRQGVQAETRLPEHVFLNYRRHDAASEAGHIYSELVERFGADSVFIDIEALAPGVDFVDGLEQEIGRCAVLLVVIGRDWLSVTGPTGQRRIDESNDFVRLEIEAALQRGIRVIPILVDGAVMPEPSDLPESIASLGRRQAIEIRPQPSYFAFDVGRLIKALEAIIRPAEARATSTATPPTTVLPRPVTPRDTEGTGSTGGRRLPRVLMLAGATLLAVALVVVLSGGKKHTPRPKVASEHVPKGSVSPPTPRALTACDQNISADPTTTSCRFAENLFVAYFDDYKANGQQAKNDVTASSPVTHQSYTMHCTNNGTRVRCSGGKGAYVTFPFWAVQVYKAP